MIKTDKKIYLYNRDRVIYTDNDKLYIRYKNEYLLLKTLNGGGTEEEEEKQKIEDEKQEMLEYEKQKIEDEKQKKLEDEKEKRQEFSLILKHMLDRVVSKTNDYYSYINTLKPTLYTIISHKTDDEKVIQKKIKHVLYDKFFMNYVLEIIGREDYYKYITFFIQIQEDDTNSIDSISDTINEHKNIYASNFEDFTGHWDKEMDKMGKREEIRKMIKEYINIIDYNNNDLYKKEKYDDYDYNKNEFQYKFEYINKNYKNLKKYVDFTIYFFNYIVYTSFKNEFDDIKNYVSKI